MKKLLFILSVIFIFLSCSKDDADSYISRAETASLVTIKLNDSKVGFYGVMDNGKTIYISKINFVYEPIENQRALFYYRAYGNPIENYNYNVEMFSIEDIPTGTVINLNNTDLDDYGNNTSIIKRAWYGGGYINIEFEFYVDNNTHQKNYINLIDTITTMLKPTENYPLILKLKSSVDINEKTSSLVKSFKCFKLGNISPDKVPIKNYVITYQTKNGDKRFDIPVTKYPISENFPPLPQWNYYKTY